MAVKIIDNCCSPKYLDCLKDIAANDGNWNMWNPEFTPFEDRFLKLNVVNDGFMVRQPILTGLAIGLLLQIYEAAGQDLFIPEQIYRCGISMKDKHRPDNIHVDHEEEGIVKLLGIINSDWEEKWGGGFFHNGTSNYIKPTSFCIFDPLKEHATEEIFTDKKRLAIDFSVFRDQQSLERFLEKNGNKQNH